MADNKLDYDKLAELAKRQRDSGQAEAIVDTRARIGYDPIRGMTYIKPQAAGFPDQTPRCITCGRAEDCACGLQCPCPVSKAEIMPPEEEQ